MKVSDIIAEFLKRKGITDCFGYPGGVICHLIDSISKVSGLSSHINYNEQASAFSACGYAQISGKPGVAFSTSGPGATNLITGIANAYFDSIPCLFITGQVDTYASADGFPVRQRGFQETNVVSIVKGISKWAIRVDNPNEILFCLEKAYFIATSGNPGPVVIDLPADVQRAEIDVEGIETFLIPEGIKVNYEKTADEIINAISRSSRPVIIAGNGIKISGEKSAFKTICEMMGVPVVFSLPAFDILPSNHPLNFGFIGTNGHRYANFLLGKADLIVSFGSRLDIRQIGLARSKFAPQAHIIRFDIDNDALSYPVHEDDSNYYGDIRALFSVLTKREVYKAFPNWLNVCKEIKADLFGYDNRDYNDLISCVSELIPSGFSFAIDVGQHQLWFAQSARIKNEQSVFMSSGHGSMGYSVPAAIGIYYASNKPVVVICGDGGLMMNVQELQFIKRERLPIKIICINNNSLGMIRGFQERNFNCNYQLTTESSGYLAPDIKKIALCFDLNYSLVQTIDDAGAIDFMDNSPGLIELRISSTTVLEPNFGRTGQIQDQMPYLDRERYNRLMSL